MTTQQEVKKLAAHLEEVTGGRYALSTYSHGDGITRYIIGRTSAADGRHDYFGDYEEVRANGAAAALVMLRAFLAGRGSR